MNYNGYLRVACFGLFSFGLLACTSKSSDYTSTPSNSDMLLEQVHPAEASPGTVVTLYGKNFGDSTLTVFFNGIPADTVFNISSLAMNAVVPVVEPGEKINVTISTPDKKLYSNGIPFLSLPVPEKVPTLYWTTHNLYRGNVNESKVEIEKLFEDDYPRGLEVDTINQEMYWGNSFGQVFKGDLKSKEVKEILRLGVMLGDIVMDSNKEWLYFIQENAIKRISLSDTTKQEILFQGRSEPRSLKLSAANDKLYWCEYGALQVLVGSVSGGSDPTVLVTTQEGLFGPRAIDLDEENDKIYIVDTPAALNSSILVSDLSGENVVKWLHSDDGIGAVVADVALDKVNGYLYWMNSKGRTNQDLDDGEIMRAKIGGNGKPEIVFQPVNYGSQLSF